MTRPTYLSTIKLVASLLQRTVYILRRKTINDSRSIDKILIFLPYLFIRKGRKMVSKSTIVLLFGALSVAMAAPGFGGGQYEESRPDGHLHPSDNSQGHLHPAGQSGGVYDDSHPQGHLTPVGQSHHNHGHLLGENGHGQYHGPSNQNHGHLLGENGHGQYHGHGQGQNHGHLLGENGHGQYHAQGQDQAQQGGQYVENVHGGGYQQHGY